MKRATDASRERNRQQPNHYEVRDLDRPEVAEGQQAGGMTSEIKSRATNRLDED
jgi:hypothetical protein